MPAVTIEDLLRGAEHRLGLSATGSLPGARRRVDQARVQSLEDRYPPKLLPGVALIIPGPIHSRWAHHPDERGPALKKISSLRIPVVFLSRSRRIPDYFVPLIEQSRICVLSSVHDAFLLESRLMGLLREKIDRICFVHGVLLNLFGRGILIAGDSGIGKTSLGVELARRGHLWVADDIIEIERKGCRLHARGHRISRNRVHVNASGIIPTGRIIRHRDRLSETILDLVIDLVRKGRPQPGGSPCKKKPREILDIAVPRFGLPVPCGGFAEVSRIEEAVHSFFKRGGKR